MRALRLLALGNSRTAGWSVISTLMGSMLPLSDAALGEGQMP